MYLTIKFIEDDMREPRLLALCNLSIRTGEPEAVKKAYHDAILETYTKDFTGNAADLLAVVSYKVMQQHPSAALISVNDNVLLADDNTLIIPLKKKGTYNVEYNQ